MRNRKRIELIFVIILLMSPFLTGGIVSVNPATDEEEIIFIPAAKERNMGRQINEKVLKTFKLPVDPLMQERIRGIGEKLSSGADRNDIVYRFTVLKGEKKDTYNAFAAPGGYVYIFSDLVEVLDTDDEIAGVLAHEMAHVEAKHSIKRLQGSLGVTALMLLGSQLKTEDNSAVYLGSAVNQLMAEYSRQDERQADELSVKYMERTGYDPMGAIGALEKLRGLRKEGKRMKYFFNKSHPYLSERIAGLEKDINGQMNFNSYINLVQDKDAM
ncbi:MAG: M48 family metalloprotease [Candidatus Omnitrophota bacterium]